MAELRRPVLLYDGSCRFCRFAARTVVRLDRAERIALLPIEDAAAAELLADVPVEDRLRSMHLVERDGRRRSGGAALSALLTHLGAVPGAGLIGRAYDPVAGRRSALGRLVPEGPAPRRYP